MDRVERIDESDSNPVPKYDDVCMLTGLHNKPELNGRAVRVCLPDGRLADDRIPCELLIGRKKLAVRPANLVFIKNDAALDELEADHLLAWVEHVEAAVFAAPP